MLPATVTLAAAGSTRDETFLARDNDPNQCQNGKEKENQEEVPDKAHVVAARINEFVEVKDVWAPDCLEVDLVAV